MKVLIALLFLVSSPVVGACEGDSDNSQKPGDTFDTLSSGSDTNEIVQDVAEVDVPEPIYPGFACAADDDCSTGICYGSATNQGVFEDSVCQLKCIGHEDFTKYCNSDSDCCVGTCCVGCGWREGLCVTD